MKYVNGDLITLAKEGRFDVIVHGCNCFNTMGAGLAKKMVEYAPDVGILDLHTKSGDPSKLGTIHWTECWRNGFWVAVVNAYTQYRYGTRQRHADYGAIRSCMREIKQDFSGKRIGLPKIGCGLAGGEWEVVKDIIAEELAGEDVTIVCYYG